MLCVEAHTDYNEFSRARPNSAAPKPLARRRLAAPANISADPPRAFICLANRAGRDDNRRVTDEEINRNFDVVADHLASLAVGVQQLTEQVVRVTGTVDRMAGTISRLSDSVDSMAGTVDRMSDKVDRTADAVASLLVIAEMHEKEMGELRAATKATDEHLNALIDTVERYIAGRNGS